MNNGFIQFLGIVKKSGNLLEGYNKCEEAIKKNKISLVVLTKECSQNTKDKFETYSHKYGFLLMKDMSKDELGRILGNKEIKLIGITNKAMSDKLNSLHKEFS
ncbi:ribosomal L7Ae/L30e/S12e/Gadd45 family protein [Haloimpatiens sp. FM7315]|uniref:ribosomal L7Ae/L30e/S12e/Gadd45 family protein n=1 Tax=Haloimpatiens sp. FM7315 TaxID=3298609 RepID=UPI0035A364E1